MKKILFISLIATTVGALLFSTLGNTSYTPALMKSNNLSDLASTATAKTNLGLAAVASSGSASDLSTGTLAAARMPTGIGSPGSILLEEHSASNSASLSFTCPANTAYNEFTFVLSGFTPVTNSVDFFMEFNNDTTVADYQSQRFIAINSSGSVSNSANNQSTVFAIGITNAASNSAGHQDGHFILYSPSSTTLQKGFDGQMSGFEGTAYRSSVIQGMYLASAATAVTSVLL